MENAELTAYIEKWFKDRQNDFSFSNLLDQHQAVMFMQGTNDDVTMLLQTVLMLSKRLDEIAATKEAGK